MLLTRQDFELEPPPWLIDDWFPLGHRCMDTAPEGSFKTMLGCWIAVCVASGSPVFGRPTYQGNVLIVDEETPKSSLEYHLERFSRGVGHDYRDLPIYVLSMEGFRFGRKTSMEKLLKVVNAVNPVFIRMDSLLAMLPSGRQRFSENSDSLGEAIRDDLNQLIAMDRTILLAAHSKKYIAGLTIDELREHEMQTIVRGHSSIVGEGCDTGLVLKKISEKPPTRFCVMTRVRRQAIPSNHLRHIELVEEEYGKGWAQLKEIPIEKLPPSEMAVELFKAFKLPDKKGNFNHTSRWIRDTCALNSQKQCRIGLKELISRSAVIETGSQSYEINWKRAVECDTDYLKMLG